VSLEKWLIERHVLHAHGADIQLDVLHPIDEQHRVAVRYQLHDLEEIDGFA
jgi:hypothetical protein